MTLLRRPEPEANGRYHHITPENASWNYVGFASYELSPGQTLTLNASDQERCLVMLSGIANINVDGESFNAVGERMSVFEKIAPHSIYTTNGTSSTITATTAVELAPP